MSSIIAHSIIGLAALEVAKTSKPAFFGGKRWLVAFPAVALLPDVDSVLAALGGSRFEFLSLPGGYPIHRGVTHSLAFALLSGLLAVILTLPREPRQWLPAWPWLAVSAATHPLIDSLMGLGAGIPLFWPLSYERFLSPFRLVPVAFFSYSVRGLISLLWNPTVWALFLHEIVLFLPFLFLARRWRASRNISEDVSPPTARGASIAGAIALGAAACPVLSLASGLRHVNSDPKQTSFIWLATWVAVVVLALILRRELVRRRVDSVSTTAARFRPIVIAVLISGLASYLV